MHSVATSIWSNADNRDFYDCVDMEQYAKVKGLSGRIDVMLAQRFIGSQNSAILEVGAGNGRVLDVLLENGYTNLFALERSEQFHGLSNRFARHLMSGALKLWHGDLTQFKTARRFDVILMLFGGLSDFASEEQAYIVRLLARYLHEKGKIILDMPFGETPNLSKGREVFLTYKTRRCAGYIPGMRDLVRYGAAAGLKLAEGMPYVVETGMSRTLLVYSK